MNSQKKMGRPTDNPKTKQIMVRLDQKCQDILKCYAEQEQLSFAEAARHGIMMLEEKIK